MNSDTIPKSDDSFNTVTTMLHPPTNIISETSECSSSRSTVSNMMNNTTIKSKKAYDDEVDTTSMTVHERIVTASEPSIQQQERDVHEQDNSTNHPTTTQTTINENIMNEPSITTSDNSNDMVLTFPQRLMEMLDDPLNAEMMAWLPHGRAFVIYKKREFANETLPKYFQKAAKYSSFTRKLNRWGFIRVTRGPETGAYYHRLFRKNEPRLVLQMTCHTSISQNPNSSTSTNVVLPTSGPSSLTASSRRPSSGSYSSSMENEAGMHPPMMMYPPPPHNYDPYMQYPHQRYHPHHHHQYPYSGQHQPLPHQYPSLYSDQQQQFYGVHPAQYGAGMYDQQQQHQTEDEMQPPLPSIHSSDESQYYTGQDATGTGTYMPNSYGMQQLEQQKQPPPFLDPYAHSPSVPYNYMPTSAPSSTSMYGSGVDPDDNSMSKQQQQYTGADDNIPLHDVSTSRMVGGISSHHDRQPQYMGGDGESKASNYHISKSRTSSFRPTGRYPSSQYNRHHGYSNDTMYSQSDASLPISSTSDGTIGMQQQHHHHHMSPGMYTGDDEDGDDVDRQAQQGLSQQQQHHHVNESHSIINPDDTNHSSTDHHLFSPAIRRSSNNNHI